MDELTDEELAELRDVARRSALRVLSNSHQHGWEDVAQDALIEYQSYARRHEVDSPGAVMWTIARRVALRRQGLWDRSRFDAIVEEDGWTPPAWYDRIERSLRSAPTPSQPLRQREERAAVRWAVEQLEPTDREIAERYYFAHPPQSAREIGEAMGMGHAAVRQRLVRLRAELSRLLEGFSPTAG